MRTVVVIVLIGYFGQVRGAELPLGDVRLSLSVDAELVEQVVDPAVRTHLVVLGALEKVDHRVEPEASELIRGRKSAFTYYLPEARQTERTGQYYRAQLAGAGELAFECAGRTCGSSSNWANRILDRAILYGPEQYQRYYVTRLDTGYLIVYVAQRATRKIYVHVEYIEAVAADFSE